MKNLTIAGLLALSAVTGMAKMVSPEEHAAKFGGILVHPDSRKGSVTFIDTQTRADVSKPLDEFLGHFRRVLPINVKVMKAAAGAPLELKKKSGSEFAIILVDDTNTPSTVIYPDDAYALINSAKFETGLKLPNDKDVYARRVAKGAMRAFVLLANGGGSRYPANVGVVHNVQELDLTQDKLPVDIQNAMKLYLEKAGVSALRRVPYQRAVQEGWAPQPTNDIQKAIWEKVHAIPQKPIKIEFDPKTDTK